MKRILFLVLWVIFGYGPQAQGAIEIYANGHKYSSPQEYLASKKPAKIVQSHQSGITAKGDPYNINLSNTTLHELYVLSIENGVVGALQDFYGTLASRSITPEQLQEAIQQAVTRSKDPKLLISEPGKVRIMEEQK